MMHIQMMFHQVFGDTLMNTATQNSGPANTGNAAESKQILLKDIGAKWSKFSEQELGALKNRDDLVDPGGGQVQPRQGSGANATSTP